MKDQFHINNCPVCNSNKFSHFLNVPDWLVSKESFEIVECNQCTFKFISNAPTPELAGPYYESEEYVEHSDTKQGLIYTVYHQARKWMLKYKLRTIKKHQSGNKLLDIGSGSGYFLNFMKKNGYDVTGVEISDKAVELCRKTFGISAYSPAEFLKNNLNKDFDLITMWHVFEHVYSFNEYFETISKSLKKTGTLIVALPNCLSFDASYNKEYWNGFDTPRHLWHFTPATFKAFAEKRGFKLKKMHSLPLDPFFNAMVSASYKRKFTFLPFTFFIGLLSSIIALFNFNKTSSIIYILEKE